jgi:hypothetical protein
MARRAYALLFVIILLLAGIAGVFGARFLLARLQSDFEPRPVWTPSAEAATEVTEQVVMPVNPTPDAPVASGDTPTPRPTATVMVVATPADVAALPPTATPTFDVSGQPGVALTPDASLTEGTPTETATPGQDLPSVFPYILAGPVRDTVGDCPGNYVLGQVTDRTGNPLPDIRLRLVDEYGNVQYAVSKPGPGDKGLYDFPVTGPPRRLTLTVIDAGDGPLSEGIEIGHQVGDTPDATCHWVDWQRR